MEKNSLLNKISDKGLKKAIIFQNSKFMLDSNSQILFVVVSQIFKVLKMLSTQNGF